MYKVITPVAAEILTTADVKLHSKIDQSAEDALLAVLITAAREWCEHYTGCSFAAQTIESAYPAFPGARAIILDVSPVSSITSVSYTDTAGVEQTVASTDYALNTYGESRRLMANYGFVWPATQAIEAAVRVRYVAGFTTLPKVAWQAMLLLVEHLYRNRGATSEKAISDIPFGVKSLLDKIKIWDRF